MGKGNIKLKRESIQRGSKKFKKAFHIKREINDRSNMEIKSKKNDYFEELQEKVIKEGMITNKIVDEKKLNYHKCIIEKKIRKPSLTKIISNLLNTQEIWINIMYEMHYILMSTDVNLKTLSELLLEKSITKDERLINYVFLLMEKLHLINIDTNTGCIKCKSQLFCDLVKHCKNHLNMNLQIKAYEKTKVLEELNSIGTITKEMLSIFDREEITLPELLHTLYCYLQDAHVTSQKDIEFDWLMTYQYKIGSIKLVSIFMSFLRKIVKKEDCNFKNILPLHKSWKQFVMWYNRQIKNLNLKHDFLFVKNYENTVCRKIEAVFPIMVVDPRYICC